MGNTIKQIISGGIIENQVLLLGVEGQGKSKFLYENQIKGKSNFKLNKSYGYNYEKIIFDGLDIGVWDLGGSEEFQQLWDVFMNSIPFNTIGFVIQPYKAKEVDSDSKINSVINLEIIAQSRKLLHFISNEFAMKDKIILLILNVHQNCNVFQDEFENEEEKKNKFKEQIKELLMWDSLQQKIKDIVVLDFGVYNEYEQVWKMQLQLFKDYKKNFKSM